MNKRLLTIISTALVTMSLCAQTLPYQNPNLSAAQRADDLLGRLTLEEKASLMMDRSPAIPRLGIPQFEWWNETLHGVGRNGIATVFPITMGLAATWDDTLVYRIFTAASDEARAKNTEARRKGEMARYRGLSFWTPNINIFRDPRWGRGQETYGEDPYLTARMGLAVVRGLQGKTYDGKDILFTVDGLQFTDDYTKGSEGLASKSTVNRKPSTVNCKPCARPAGALSSERTVNIRMAFLFGFFQALMPLIGWAGISHFQSYMEAYDHWIAFSLLGFIGGRMVWESFHPEEGQHFNPRRLQTQLLLAIATSIDALAVGISFACTGYEQLSQLWMPLAVIGMVSFLFSLLGYWAGYHFGRGIISRFKPELIGGVILILIGVRILMSHLGYI